MYIMKKLLLWLPLFGILLASCSNEFDIAAPWKNIPVMYAMLSPKDTAHYVRVEKAFLDPDGSALVAAQQPDSIYYDPNSIDVYIQKVGAQQRYPLSRVDGVLEGITRDSGIFAESPNWLYKIKPAQFGGLEPGASYRITLEFKDGSSPVFAEAAIPKDFIPTEPNPQLIPVRIGFSNQLPTNIIWRTDVNGVLFNVNLRVRYREEDANGNLVKRETLEWFVGNTKREEAPVGAGLYRAKIAASGQAFFRLLAEKIPPANIGHFRYFENVEITIEGGGKEIEDYQITAQANAGITGAEIISTFTNLQPAGAGFGIVTAKNTLVRTDIRMTTATVDSMNVDPLTKPLNFRY